jgi:hypothetical protein
VAHVRAIRRRRQLRPETLADLAGLDVPAYPDWPAERESLLGRRAPLRRWLDWRG